MQNLGIITIDFMYGVRVRRALQIDIVSWSELPGKAS